VGTPVGRERRGGGGDREGARGGREWEVKNSLAKIRYQGSGGSIGKI